MNDSRRSGWWRNFAAGVSALAIIIASSLLSSPTAHADVVFTPGPVTNVAAVVGDGEITLTWDAPTSGAEPDEYWVFSMPTGGGATTRECAIVDPSIRTCNFAANNGQYRDAWVIAVNRVLSSEYQSSPFGATDLLPSPPPNAPSITAISYPNPGSILVEWTPASDMPQETTHTRVTASPGGLYCESEYQNRCGITGLNNGQTYQLVAVSYNVIGASEASRSVDAVPYTSPDAPTSPTATEVGVGKVRVSWAPPSFNGGRDVTGYTVALLDTGKGCEVTAEVSSCTFEGVTTSPVQASILATNILGGDASATTNPVNVTLLTAKKTAKKAKKGKKAQPKIVVSGQSATPNTAITVKAKKGKALSATADSNGSWAISTTTKRLGKGAVTATCDYASVKVS